MLKRKPAKCATPSIKELLDALDLEERNESRAADHLRPSSRPVYAPSPPPAPWPAHDPHDQMTMRAQPAFAHPHDPYPGGIAEAHAPHHGSPVQLYAPAHVELPRLETSRPEPLRPVPAASAAHAASSDEARVRLAAISRTSGLVSHGVAVVGALVVMVPSALYLVAPLLWPSSVPAVEDGAAKPDETKSAKRTLAVASVAVVPVAAPRAAAPSAVSTATSSAEDFDRFTALSNAATSMQLPAAAIAGLPPEGPPAPPTTAVPDMAHAPTIEARVPRVDPPSAPATSSSPPAAFDTAAAAPVAPAYAQSAPLAATAPGVLATQTGVTTALAITPEPLRARVPLTALSADPPALVATTKPTAAATIQVPIAPSRLTSMGPVASPDSKTTPPLTSKDSVTAARATILIERGRQLAAAGDMAGARLLYELAAKSGNVEGKRLFEATLAAAASIKSAATASAVASAGVRTRPEGASALGAPGTGAELRQLQAAPGN